MQRIQKLLPALALTVTILSGALAPVVHAVPSAASLSASRAAVARAVARYDSARRRADAIDASIARQSTALDRLVAEQQVAQARLSSHVASTYRYGVTSFIEVIASSTSFEQFATRLYILSRINQQDAVANARLKAARARSVATARELMTLQTAASMQVRAAKAAQSRARSELAGNTAAYAAYLRQVAATSRPKHSELTRVVPAWSRPSLHGTGEWKSAKASHYGSGSWGHHTADGTTIHSDSMIVAHKTLPFGTLVEFEYGGKRAVARVADRGPYTAGREWDLGPGVIAVLDFNGVHTVRYRVIGR